MIRSDQINELAAALAKAQSEMGTAARDGTNPHFGNQYATLASVLAACRAPLTKYQLSLVQSPRIVSAGDERWIVELETMLVHASGQFLSDVVAVPVLQLTAQSLGSCVTYLRRYSMLSFTGLAPASDDDDGNAAVGDAPAIARPAIPREPRAKAKKTQAMDGVTQTIIGRVASVARRVLASGKEKLIVKLVNDAREFETWSKSVATAARDAKDLERDVELLFRPTKFGLDLLTIRNPHEPEPPL